MSSSTPKRPRTGGKRAASLSDGEAEAARVTAEEKRRKVRTRALGLIARAAHAGTPEEEARTSALFAARIIHEEKLLEGSGVDAREPRHPLFDRLEGLDDRTLDMLGGVVEATLDGATTSQGTRGPRVGAGGGHGKRSKAAQLETTQAAAWREEAQHLQRKLDAFAGSLRWILQGYKIGLAERPGYCGICHRPLLLGDITIWKRKRIDCVHYACCVAALHQQGAIP